MTATVIPFPLERLGDDSRQLMARLPAETLRDGIHAVQQFLRDRDPVKRGKARSLTSWFQYELDRRASP